MTASVHTLESFPALRSPDRPLDPPGEYRHIYEGCRVPRVTLPSGQEVYLVGRYDDVRAVLAGPVSADGTNPGFPMARGGAAPSSNALSFFRMDGADHRRYRKLTTADFTLARVAELRPVIQTIADELVDGIERRPEPVDLVTELALPVPSRVICHILGVPYADWDYFHKLSDTLTRGPAQGREAFASAISELHSYIGRLALAKKADPGEDLLTALVVGFEADSELDPRQLAAIVLLLLVAGHEMIASTISLGALALMTDPDAREALAADPGIAPNAAEELLRITSVTQWVPRAVVEDFTVGGQVLQAGEGAVILPLMANRDDDVFPDPDRIDLHRANADRHLAFGFGPHQCLGLQLARIELQVVLETLFRRLPRLRPAVPAEQLRFREQSAVFAVEELPIVS